MQKTIKTHRFFYSLLLAVLFPLLCWRPTTLLANKRVTVDLFDWTRQAVLIAKGKVTKVEPVPARQDQWVVTFDVSEFLKDTNPKSPKRILIVEERLFPQQAPMFKPFEESVLFLKRLPDYPIFKTLNQQGIYYHLMGQYDDGKISDPIQQQDLITWLKTLPQTMALETDSAPKPFRTQELLEELEKNRCPLVQNTLARALFKETSFTPEDLNRIVRLFSRKELSDTSKWELLTGLKELPNNQSHPVFSQLFCLEPRFVCLISAEALESNQNPLPISRYQEVLNRADTDLKVDLLQVLGRNRREDALPLFEKMIEIEKNEQVIGRFIEALGDIPSPKSEELCLRYGKDTRYYVRVGVLISLGKLKSEKGLGIIEQAIQTSDPSLVTLSAKSLEQIGTAAALETLHKYYEKEHHGYWEPRGVQPSSKPKHFLPK